MSKIGVNTNIFQVTGKYMNLINEYIVSRRSQVAPIDTRKQDEVVSLFSRIADDQNMEPPIQLLSVIIERDLRQQRKQPRQFFRKLIDDLAKGDNSEETLHELEVVVSALDTKHTEALAKIKGE
ncbi:hypothetical protein [Spirosoma gilvum]